ncbi:MAG: DUF2970 domain-containing protein [Burkholderiales bacterium]
MIETFKAVLWSFFGVRKQSEYEADTRRLDPRAVIIAGIVAAAVLVLGLYGLVKLVAP